MVKKCGREYCGFKRRLVIFFLYFVLVLKVYSLSGIDYLKNIKALKGGKFIQIVKLNNPFKDIDVNLLKIDISKEIQSNAIISSISNVIDSNNFSFIKIKIEYSFDSLGFFRIPSLKITYKDYVYLSSEFEVSVLKPDEIDSFGLPIDLYWDLDKKEIYEYQSIGIVLRSGWLPDSNYSLLSASLPTVKDAMVEKMPIFEDIRYRTFYDKEILDVPFYNFILTPIRGSENVLIPSFAFSVAKNLIRMSPELSLKVKPIPSEVKSLAVGNFKIDYEFPTSELIDQDIFTVLIKITGYGNFPHLYFPKIVTYNSKIIYKKRNYNFEPVKNGYKGSISEVYTIRPGNKGNIYLNIEDFIYFNPDDRGVYSLEGKNLKFKYAGNMNKKNTEHVNLGTDLSLLTYFDILSCKNKTFLFFVPYYYLVLVPGFLLSLAFFIKYRKFFTASSFGLGILILTIGVSLNAISYGSLSEENINSVIENYNSKNYSISLIKIDNILKKYPNYSGLWINRALILSKMDKSFDAIYSAYKAFINAPNSEDSYKIINFIETRNGVVDNIRSKSLIFSNIFFIISLILMNFLLVTVSYVFFSKNLKRTIMILLFLGICFTSFETYYFYSKQQSEIGIVKGDLVSLYKVPDNFSRSWRFLKGNVSVYVLDSKDDFVLIETGYGLQGWIHKNFIVSLKDNII